MNSKYLRFVSLQGLSRHAGIDVYINRSGPHWPANDKTTPRSQPHRIYQQFGLLALLDEGKVDEYIPIHDESRDERKIIEKYSGRGFQFVDYFSCGAPAHGGVMIGYYGGRFRCVSDTGCRKVSFKPYIKHENWRIPFDIYYKALDYISWFETMYKTTSTHGILIDDYPYQCKGSKIDIDWSGPNQFFDPMQSSYAAKYSEAIAAAWLRHNIGYTKEPEKFFHAYRYPC